MTGFQKRRFLNHAFLACKNFTLKSEVLNPTKKNPSEIFRIRRISNNNFEIISRKDIILIIFIPKRAVNQTFVGKKNYPLTWFEIKGENNCIITHGEHKRIDSGMIPRKLKEEIKWLKEHFLEELREIAK